MTTRHYSALDQCVINLDQMVRTVFGGHTTPERANPADVIQQEASLSDEERLCALRLMRVNHAGEVAAQALYQGQALTARGDGVHDAMVQASREENDHLAWCEDRIKALGGHTSLLNPAWYMGSLLIGAAGRCGGGQVEPGLRRRNRTPGGQTPG